MDVSSKTDVLTPKAPVADGTYDLVVSLGANCTAAAQLRIRGLRHVALPFDWLYVVDERPFVWLADHVSDNWSGLCLKENLSEITPDHPEWNSEHLDRVKYVDAESGYRLVNHFNASIDNEEEYLRVYGTLRRRIERLVSICQGGGDILFLLATEVRVQEATLAHVLSAFQRRFPAAHFSLRYLHFGTGESGERDSGSIHISEIGRHQNRYDFVKTNFEWAFLDEVRVRNVVQEPSPPTDDIRWRRCLSSAIKMGLPYGIVRGIQKWRNR